MRKLYTHDKEKEIFKRLDIKSEKTKLFDISAFKYVMNVNYYSCEKKADLYECTTLIHCTCEKAKKITVIEQRFIYLQRMHMLGKQHYGQKGNQKIGKKLKRKLNRSPKCDILKQVSTQAVCIESDSSQEEVNDGE